MAATIKLMRVGKRSYALYRIVVMDKRKKRNGAYIEKIGFYDPHKEPHLQIDKDKLQNWLSKGAVLSQGTAKLLKKG